MKQAKQKHDLVAISITDPREETLPDVGLIELEDAESGETLLVDTHDKEMTKEYVNQYGDYLMKQILLLLTMGTDLILKSSIRGSS